MRGRKLGRGARGSQLDSKQNVPLISYVQSLSLDKGVTYVVRANMGADITVNRNFAAHSPGSAR
jgi:hypothetical protein